MPKIAKELGALAVAKLKHPGGKTSNHYVAVGTVSGLIMQITPSGSKSWILRTRVGFIRREIGLGAYPAVTLALAHEAARSMKDTIRCGVDPVAQRQGARVALIAQQARNLSFADAVDRYLETPYMLDQSEKQRGLWRSTLANFATPILGKLSVADIGANEIKSILEPVWNEKRETARRVRSRVEAVLGWAADKGHRSGTNPAALASLQQWIKDYSSDNAGKKDNQPALAIGDAPLWFSALHECGGTGARALEFLVFTAARSGEVRGATWSEIDLESKMWTIPKERMKMVREHVVPLSDAAVTLLTALPRFADNDFLFPATRGGQLSDATLSAVMRRMNESRVGGWIDARNNRPAVPHGLRSTFKDWAIEKTDYPSDMSEIALAHKVGGNVEQAYRRGAMVEKRRSMMADWANFLAG